MREFVEILLVLSVVVMIGAIVLVYCTRKPGRHEHAEWLTSVLIAHKGIHDGNIPENTIASFSKAVAFGKPIELDLSMTKDKQIIVFHDKKLTRLFGIDSNIKDMTTGELNTLKFPNSTETIPLFRDVLQLINGKVPLIIEIKNEGKVGEMEQKIFDELKSYTGKYAIQSFNPFSVKWFRVNAPEVIRGQLSGNFIVSDYEVKNAGITRLPWIQRFLLSNLLLDFESKPNYIAYEIQHTEVKTFRKLKKLGVPVLGWTVQNREEYQKFKDICDNLITDTYDLN